MSETSQLLDEIRSDLISGDGKYSLVLLDSAIGAPVSQTEVSINLDNPYSFDTSRFIPNQDVCDLPRFLKIASEVIEDAQAREGVVPEERVRLVEDFYGENMALVGDEAIAYKLIKRSPANMTRKADGRPQRASNYGYDLRSAKLPNKVIIVESRPIDHKIEFSCWGKTAQLANKRALWLEKLFITHAWAFKVQGTERFYWSGRGPDVFWNTGGQRLHQRPINFFVRLREFEVFAHPVIKVQELEVQLLKKT